MLARFGLGVRGGEETYTTLEVSVPKAPKKERRAMVLRAELGVCL